MGKKACNHESTSPLDLHQGWASSRLDQSAELQAFLAKADRPQASFSYFGSGSSNSLAQGSDNIFYRVAHTPSLSTNFPPATTGRSMFCQLAFAANALFCEPQNRQGGNKRLGLQGTRVIEGRRMKRHGCKVDLPALGKPGTNRRSAHLGASAAQAHRSESGLAVQMKLPEHCWCTGRPEKSFSRKRRSAQAACMRRNGNKT